MEVTIWQVIQMINHIIFNGTRQRSLTGQCIQIPLLNHSYSETETLPNDKTESAKKKLNITKT